jgi:hypothetical protein
MALMNLYWHYAMATSHQRVMPDYLIIGTMKGGTSSLHNYLRMHPDVLPAYKKEIHYFDLNIEQGSAWYRAHFPPKRKKTPGKITGDASPYYIFHPLTAGRASQMLPDAKIIVVLRNPIDRAFSHYNHNRRKGRETRSFEDAIEGEFEIIDIEEDRIITNQAESLFTHRHFSYLSRGLYARQLKRWLSYYDRKNILVMKSEDLFDKTEETFLQVTRFLGLKDWMPSEFETWNVGSYISMKPETWEALARVFEQPNRELSTLVDQDFNWNDTVAL